VPFGRVESMPEIRVQLIVQRAQPLCSVDSLLLGLRLRASGTRRQSGVRCGFGGQHFISMHHCDVREKEWKSLYVYTMCSHICQISIECKYVLICGRRESLKPFHCDCNWYQSLLHMIRGRQRKCVLIVILVSIRDVRLRWDATFRLPAASHRKSIKKPKM